MWCTVPGHLAVPQMADRPGWTNMSGLSCGSRHTHLSALACQPCQALLCDHRTARSLVLLLSVCTQLTKPSCWCV